ncbi:hypothetical protein BJ508DRAFT_306563 [Ascobolus immersus RN42]|uniref:DUF4470 domain-containing protein n=1 Tax=Ascobolus immersus RN42 TaxID=1160509 RepID=A0A3N4I7S0_ASCIM|nr:hypothetical protein BJ508DRAFT_306563 [Ascobolus immersus RN42]
MAHVFCYWPRPFFYAFGNTPAVCLTDHLSPEEDAEVLLLGCGDVRNLLYTMFVDDSHGRVGKAKLDVTCCDLEPGVLARNILLFSMLADDIQGKHTDHIWSFYYDIYLSDETSKFVTAQARKLSKLSGSMEVWHNGAYGKWLRMVSVGSLETLHGLWSNYARVSGFSAAQKETFAQNYAHGVEESKKMAKGLDAAAPVRCVEAFASKDPSFTESLYGCQEQLWKTGTTSTTGKTARTPNPTLAFTGNGDNFCLHYASNPALGFHLLPIIVACKGPKKVGKKTTPSTIFIECRRQFSSWTTKFRSTLQASLKSTGCGIVFRFFVGDVFAVCTGLQEAGRATGIDCYPHAWSPTQLVLNEADYCIGDNAERPNQLAAPTRFNTIDTSNLVDHVGMLNLLTATIPLLQKSLSSTLLTESLANDGAKATESLQDGLFGDPLTMALLLGVFPSSYFVGYSSRSTAANALLIAISDPQKRGARFERIPWKALQSGFTDELPDLEAKISVDPAQLYSFLYQKIYLLMFEHENLSNRFQAMRLGQTQLAKYNNFHYIRESFAKFLAFLKTRLDVEWKAVMDGLILCISQDKDLFGGMRRFQELCTQFEILGVYDTSGFVPAYLKEFPGAHPGPPQIMLWRSIPLVVSVTMVVPRRKLSSLLTHDSAMGSPVLQARVTTPKFTSEFHSLQVAFGKVLLSSDGTVTLEQDPDGIKGSSDVVVTFRLLSWLIRDCPERTEVSLGVYPTMYADQYFKPKLGSELEFYSTKLAITDSVYISELPPNFKNASKPISSEKTTVKPSTSALTGRTITAHFSGPSFLKLQKITVKVSQGLPAAGKLSSMQCKSQACNTIALSVGPTCRKNIQFPLPIDFGTLKKTVDKKVPYIELTASVGDVQPLYYEIQRQKRFPMLPTAAGMVLWNIHRLSLDSLPAIDLSVGKHDWISGHLGCTMSAKERKVHLSEDTTGNLSNTLVGIKDTISHLFLIFQNAPTDRTTKMFAISTRANAEAPKLDEYIILVSDMRFDLASQTAVLDAHILRLSDEIAARPEVKTFLLRNAKFIRTLIVGEKEERLWKELLPSFVERARGDLYSHDKTKCEYMRGCDGGKFKVPLSYDLHEPFLCSCSRGKASKEFLSNKDWKGIAKHVSRAAISPLFHAALKETGATEAALSASGSGGMFGGGSRRPVDPFADLGPLADLLAGNMFR